MPLLEQSEDGGFDEFSTDRCGHDEEPVEVEVEFEEEEEDKTDDQSQFAQTG